MLSTLVIAGSVDYSTVEEVSTLCSSCSIRRGLSLAWFEQGGSDERSGNYCSDGVGWLGGSELMTSWPFFVYVVVV